VHGHAQLAGADPPLPLPLLLLLVVVVLCSGAVLRMAGQLGYLVLSSVTMNENLFQVMLANVHNLLVSWCTRGLV
jgi:hypothetical protein